MFWLVATQASETADATRDSAMITAVGVVAVAVIGLIGIWLQRRTHQKLDQQYHHLNNISENEDTEGAPTLGQQVVGTRSDIQELKQHLDGRISEIESKVAHQISTVQVNVEKQHAEIWAQLAHLAKTQVTRSDT